MVKKTRKRCNMNRRKKTRKIYYGGGNRINSIKINDLFKKINKTLKLKNVYDIIESNTNHMNLLVKILNSTKIDDTDLATINNGYFDTKKNTFVTKNDLMTRNNNDKDKVDKLINEKSNKKITSKLYKVLKEAYNRVKIKRRGEESSKFLKKSIRLKWIYKTNLYEGNYLPLFKRNVMTFEQIQSSLESRQKGDFKKGDIVIYKGDKYIFNKGLTGIILKKNTTKIKVESKDTELKDEKKDDDSKLTEYEKYIRELALEKKAQREKLANQKKQEKESITYDIQFFDYEKYVKTYLPDDSDKKNEFKKKHFQMLNFLNKVRANNFKLSPMVDSTITLKEIYNRMPPTQIKLHNLDRSKKRSETETNKFIYDNFKQRFDKNKEDRLDVPIDDRSISILDSLKSFILFKTNNIVKKNEEFYPQYIISKNCSKTPQMNLNKVYDLYDEYDSCHNVKVKYLIHDVNITLMNDDKLIEKLYDLGDKDVIDLTINIDVSLITKPIDDTDSNSMKMYLFLKNKNAQLNCPYISYGLFKTPFQIKFKQYSTEKVKKINKMIEKVEDDETKQNLIDKKNFFEKIILM